LQEFLTKRGLKPLLQKLDNKAPAGLKNAWNKTKSTINSCHLTSIGRMPQKVPSDVGKIILLQASAAPTKMGQCVSGADFCHNVSWP
jgi:hypothetical protein